MRNTVRKGLLLAFLGSVSAGSVSAQIKVEAESAVKMHSEKTEIILENEKKSVGYFDEVGEYMTYEVNIPEAGLYQFSFKYLTGKDGDLKIEGPDGGSSIFPIEANHLTANWWDLPMGSWPEFDFDQSALYYFEAGKQTFTVHNTGWALNIDFFSLKKSSATDSKVVSVKTSPNKVELMPNESVLITPMAFNAEGQMLAAAATWSANAKDGVYKSGSSTGADVVTVSMGGVEKKVNVKIAKPSKKQEFVVTKHGKLNTKGGAVCDASGNKVSLMGPSFFWSCSAPLWWTKETVNHLVKNYNIQIIRLPVSIAPGDNTWTDHSATWNEDNYLHRPEYTRALVDEMVKAAIENDIYVIIDFHEHYAQHWVDLSKDFFTYFATKWGEYPNVMYEIYNEPMTDNGTVVNYAKEIIPVIRKIDDDNIIIVGSTQYSREPDNVTAAGSGYSNIAYTWHGYVEWGHQSDWNGKNTWNNGVPIVVTEWGLNWSKNDGGLINLYKEKSLINCFWSMSNKGGDDAKWSILKDDVFKTTDWSASDMTENGAYLLGVAKNWVNYKPVVLQGVVEDLTLGVSSNAVFYLPENSTTLSAVADGGTGNYTFSWKQTTGPSNAAIAQPSAASTKVSDLEVGDYTFSVTVTDGEDEISKVVKITVRPEGYVEPGLIDDVTDNDIITRLGGSWDVFNDADKTASSHTSITKAEQLANNGAIKAELKMGDKWQGDGWMGEPYGGVEVYLSQNKESIDLSNCTKISYRFRGSAHAFRAEMSAIDDEDYHSVSVGASEDWTEVSVSWSSLKQASDWGKDMDLDKSDIRKFSWQVTGNAKGNATLEIDDLTCYGMDFSSAVENTSAESVSMVVYPNPARDGKCFVQVAERCSVQVVDISGRVVFSTVAVPEFATQISLSSTGVYFLRAGNEVKKVIVK